MAEDDLGLIEAWYRQPGAGVVARRTIAALIGAIDRLAYAPLLHPIDQISRNRRMIVARHAVIYTVDAEAAAVLVIRVLGPGQAGIET